MSRVWLCQPRGTDLLSCHRGRKGFTWKPQSLELRGQNSDVGVLGAARAAHRALVTSRVSKGFAQGWPLRSSLPRSPPCPPPRLPSAPRPGCAGPTRVGARRQVARPGEEPAPGHRPPALLAEPHLTPGGSRPASSGGRAPWPAGSPEGAGGGRRRARPQALSRHDASEAQPEAASGTGGGGANRHPTFARLPRPLSGPRSRGVCPEAAATGWAGARRRKGSCSSLQRVGNLGSETEREPACSAPRCVLRKEVPSGCGRPVAGLLAPAPAPARLLR